MAKKKSTKRTRKAAGRKRTARTTQMSRATVAAHDADVHVDGCDIDFAEHVTPDSELPPARGGVEIVRTRRRAR